MRAQGWADNVVDLRYIWGELFVQARLRAWCNRLIRETGGGHEVSRESEASRASRKAHALNQGDVP